MVTFRLLILAGVLFIINVLAATNDVSISKHDVDALVAQYTAEFDSLTQKYANKRVNNASSDSFDIKKTVSSSKKRTVPELVKISSLTKNSLAVLEDNDVDASLQSEILSMSSALTPREGIIAHVLTHFPNMNVAQASDIVTATHVAAGRSQPNSQQFSKHRALKAAQRMEKYKKSVEARDARIENK